MSNSEPQNGRLTPLRRRVLDREFERLLELDESARNARVEALARRCPRLTRWLGPLLTACSQSSDHIEAIIGEMVGSAVSSLDSSGPELPPGTRLGAWRLIEAVGSGGMGTVYRAERADGAFEMEAAIKLIRMPHDKRLADRLTVERQLLARLDHPNIARILDGGTTEDGQAYLVMEWITGSDLNHCAASHRGDHHRCVAIFRRIAEAVGHAHQRRVVHGDIKPANVRIGEDGRVRLLDFGVARLLAEEQGETDGGIRALTPAFSAPEVRRGEPASTPSDVWALGALLHWMLSGKTFSKASDIDADRIASVLSGCCPRHHDMAAIIAVACARDPQDRYPDVSGLLKDLERYCQMHPVQARPATRGYLLKRFVQRNPVGVSLSTISMALLVIGLTGTAWQAHLAGLERDRAQVERDRTRVEAAKAERISEFLVELFEHADPHRSMGEEITARELVRQGAERIKSLEETPLVQAAMYQVLARVNRSLAEHEIAHQMANRALDILSDHPSARRADLAEAWTLMGATMSSLGQYAEAEQAHRTALALTDSSDRAATARALNNLGLTLYSLSRFSQAEPLLREAMQIQERENPHSAALASAFNNLALVLAATDRQDEAEPLYRQALAIRRDVLGESHPMTTYSMTNLATLLAQNGQWQAAEQAYLQALKARRTIFGDEHPAVASVLYQLGWLHSQRDDFAHAREFYERAITIRRLVLGEDHPSVAVMLNALAQTAREQGELAQAETWLTEALETYRSAYGESHHDIALVLANLGATRLEKNDHDGARELLLEALEMNRRELGETHRHVGDNLARLAELYLQTDQPERALEWARRAQSVFSAVHEQSDHPTLRENGELIARIKNNRSLQ